MTTRDTTDDTADFAAHVALIVRMDDVMPNEAKLRAWSEGPEGYAARIDAMNDDDTSAELDRPLKAFAVEYRSPTGRIQTHRTSARTADDAMERAVEALGIDFGAIQSTEERGA